MQTPVTTLGSILVNDALPVNFRDYSRVMDKDTVSELMDKIAKTQPEDYEKTLKDLGDVAGVMAMLSGHSIGLEDLKSVPLDREKANAIRKTLSLI